MMALEAKNLVLMRAYGGNAFKNNDEILKFQK
jgi:hypothetical protein